MTIHEDDGGFDSRSRRSASYISYYSNTATNIFIAFLDDIHDVQQVIVVVQRKDASKLVVTKSSIILMEDNRAAGRVS